MRWPIKNIESLTFLRYVGSHVDTIQPRQPHQDQYCVVKLIWHRVLDVSQLRLLVANIIQRTELNLKEL